MKRAFSVLLLGLLVLAALALAAIWWIGAWHLLFPSTHHDSAAPELPLELERPAVLLFSKTNSFRHRDGIDGGVKGIRAIAQARGWGVMHTENGAVFNDEELSAFSVVSFVNATGDMLSAAQRDSFQRWMQAGGGWLGIHAAGDGSHAAWPWYVDNLIGAEFTAHVMGPQFQTATVRIDAPNHPAMAGMPASWQHEEEWYSWKTSPRTRGFTVLATVDEGSYQPYARLFGEERDLRMGDHPVVWTRPVGSGQGLYIAMGHREDAFASADMRRLLEGSLAFLLDRSSTTH